MFISKSVLESTYLKNLFSRQERNLVFLISLRQYLESCPTLFNLQEQEKFDKISPAELRKPYIDSFLLKRGIKDENIARYYHSNFRVLDNEEYEKDPYYQLLQNVEIKENNWRIVWKNVEKYQLFIYDDCYMMMEDNRLSLPIGCFKKDYRYPSIELNGNEWMSLNPNEINTNKLIAQMMKGKVLTLGLGLGYFAYLASENPNVKEVHAVEMDKELILMFEKNILPKFPHKEKVHIHKAEAFSFVSNLQDGEYDYIYSDLWHDVSDGLAMYIKLRQAFKSFTKTSRFYWIESTLLTYYRIFLTSYIYNVVNKKEIDATDEVSNNLKNGLEQLKIETIDDFRKLFTNREIGKIIEQIM